MNELESYLQLLGYGAYASIGTIPLLVIHMIFSHRRHSHPKLPPERKHYNVGELRYAMRDLPPESTVTDLDALILGQRMTQR